MKLKLKDVIFMAIAAAVFGVIYLGFVYVGAAITGALTPSGLGPLGYTPFYGVFFMAATFVSYVVRKPGIGIAAELIAAIIEVLLGNFFGPGVIINGLIQGGACELIFAIGRYKKWNLGTMMMAGVSVAFFSFLYDCFHDSYYLLGGGMVAALLIGRIVSAVIFTGLISKLLADGLNKAGVLKGYAISGKKADIYEE